MSLIEILRRSLRCPERESETSVDLQVRELTLFRLIDRTPKSGAPITKADHSGSPVARYFILIKKKRIEVYQLACAEHDAEILAIVSDRFLHYGDGSHAPVAIGSDIFND